MVNFKNSKTIHLDCVSQHLLNRDLEIASECPPWFLRRISFNFDWFFSFFSSPLNINKQAVGFDTAAADLEEILWGGSKEQINNFEEDDFNEPLGDDVDLDNVAVTNLQDNLGKDKIAWSENRIFKSSCNFKLFFHKSCRLNNV